MEEIINKIVAIDNQAKSIWNIQKQKEKNMEEQIEREFQGKKIEIDKIYQKEITKENQKYEIMLQRKKEEIDISIQEKLQEIEKHYHEQEETIIQQMIDKMKEEA